MLHRVDFREICGDVVIAAALAGQQMEAAPRECVRWTRAAEMNYRGQLFLPLPADFRSSPISEGRRDVAVQEYRRKLGGAARHKDGLVSPVDEGTPQGGPLSPLLSNLVLDACWSGTDSLKP